jgi:hypothetical protein
MENGDLERRLAYLPSIAPISPNGNLEHQPLIQPIAHLFSRLLLVVMIGFVLWALFFLLFKKQEWIHILSTAVIFGLIVTGIAAFFFFHTSCAFVPVWLAALALFLLPFLQGKYIPYQTFWPIIYFILLAGLVALQVPTSWFQHQLS